MKKLLFLTFYVLSFYAFSTETRGYYVTNSNDTIQAIFAIKYISDDQTLNCTLRNNVKIINSDGTTYKAKPDELKSFSFTNYAGKLFTFETIEFNGKKIFAEVVRKGKDISMYYFDEPGHSDFSEIFPSYLVKYKNKEIRFCNKKKAFLKYVDYEKYFVERFEEGEGLYKYLLLSIIDDYNNYNN